MSLVNQMLQDLDSRRAADGPKSGLPNDVRPLPAVRRSGMPLVVVGGVVLLAVALWFLWQAVDSSSRPERRSEGLAVVQPIPPSETQTPVMPSSQPVPAAATGDVVAAAPAASSDVSAESDESRLRLTTSLRILPDEVPAVRRELPVVPPRAATPIVAMAATPAPSAKAPGAVLIEKSTPSGALHERAENEYRKALSALNAGRSSEAMDGLRTALKQDGEHSASRQLLFKLLVENKRFDEAADLLREGLQLQPAQLSWAMSLARLQVDRGDLPGAWRSLQQSLSFAANSAEYQGFSAHVLQRLGRSKEAVEYYQSATRLAPAEGRWWLGLGLALESDGHVAEARDALLRARASGTLNAELNALVDQKLR
jgi:MSHA biogenesis protein MshN